MTPGELLGNRLTLKIRRITDPGAYLVPEDSTPDEDAILLPAREIPDDARQGSDVLAFVYLDSEDRPIATTREPKLTLGEVRFLEVTAITPIGAFVDWGLPKELLIPFAQQSRELFVGERQPIGLYVDNTGRLAGTMFVTDMLSHRPPKVALDEMIEGEAWRNDPEIGLFAILERSYVGLVPASEPHSLKRGEVAKFRVSSILPDGKLVLSLRQQAHKEIEADAGRIVAVLSRAEPPKVGDKSDPETIRALFGVSKKAFKRAVGRLLKEGAVVLDDDGSVILRK
jgi:predicted RNA-binding protein (virulence factor B family)